MDFSNPEHWAAVLVNLVVLSVFFRQVYLILKKDPSRDFEAIRDLLFRLLFPARWKQAQLDRLAWDIDKLERACEIGPYAPKFEIPRAAPRGMTWVTDDNGHWAQLDAQDVTKQIEHAQAKRRSPVRAAAPCELGQISHAMTLAGTCIICGGSPHAVDEVSGAAVCFICGRSDGSISDHVHELPDPRA